jgi:predicted negative regulator of RcsB-dependent stress response
VGTTKLTRKEILAEDPVHEAIIQIIEFFREQGKLIAVVAAAVVLLSVGIYFGLEYLDSRETASQHQLAKALGLYHARIDATAPDDPYGKGPEPLFRTDDARLQAASKAFADIASKYSSSKTGIVARYYLGLCQLHLGQKKEAVQALEAVRNNSKDRTLGYFAKKVLARHYADERNFKAAQEILDGMINDPQCSLPKEDLKLDLARIYSAQGKRDEAIKLLRQARDEAGKSSLLSILTQELGRLEEGGGSKVPVVPSSLTVRP